MLFVFETWRAQKVLLKVTSRRHSSVDILEMDSLLQTLHAMESFTTLPDDGGEILKFTKIEGIHVLVWNFDEFTPCSSAEEKHFSSVVSEISHNKLLINPKKGGEISFPYFTLDQNAKPDPETCYPSSPLEIQRITALRTSLGKLGYIVHNFVGNTHNHFCEFSRGGDIYFINEVSIP